LFCVAVNLAKQITIVMERSYHHLKRKGQGLKHSINKSIEHMYNKHIEKKQIQGELLTLQET